MQYQIQQIRQYISSIDHKYQPTPAFVVTRPLFTCRSMSPSFYKLRSKTPITPITPISYSVVRISPTQIKENKFTFKDTDNSPSRETPIKELKEIKLTKVHQLHEEIISKSQERFSQQKRQPIMKNQSTEKISDQNQLLVQFKEHEMSKVQQLEQQQFPQKNSIDSSGQLQQQQQQLISKKLSNINHQKKDHITQNIQENQVNNDIQQVIQELPEIKYTNETQQQSNLKLWACNPNNSQRKSNQKKNSKKSPNKSIKSPKKQHIIYYNQIYLYKPRENKRLNSSKLSYNSSQKQISPKKQNKQISYILTSPSRRNTRKTFQDQKEDDEIEIINLAPEFSRLI